MTERSEAEKRAAALRISLSNESVAKDYLTAVRAMERHVGNLPRELPVGVEPALTLSFA